MDYKEYIVSKINFNNIVGRDDHGAPPVGTTLINSFLTECSEPKMGDYSLACFKIASILKNSPVKIAESVKNSFVCDDIVSEVSAVNGYVNFKLNKENFIGKVINEILEKGEGYGKSGEGEGKTVVLDYSSINIAKPFHMGHLSTTVIGGALYRIFNFLGYKTVGVNHLGDYGTQFGELITAYKRWGSRAEIEKGKIKELMRLYVKYHEEAEKDKTLENEAREYFKKIENGDKECTELFNYFKEITLNEVDKIYKRLNIKFDSYAGESFYNDKMDIVIKKLEKTELLQDSDGAKIVDLSEYNMPPCLILKKDGASLYATRDIAAALYRYNTYKFYKCLYVVAYQQNLHFKQFFKVIELMGEPFASGLEHIAYGMVSLEEGAMSTRKGIVVFLEDVLNKSAEKALEIINQKSPLLENKAETAEKIGAGAVIFSALYNSRIKDIVFSYDKVLNFDGETAPYVQYSMARCYSVLAKGGKKGAFKVEKADETEFILAKALHSFKQTVRSAAEKYEPSFIARLAVEIAQAFNKFYFDCKILSEDENVRNYRLSLTKASLTVLKICFSLLGIDVIEKM